MKRIRFIFILSLLSILSLCMLTSCTAEDCVEKSYEITEEFCIIIMEMDSEDITILPSTDGKCSVDIISSPGVEHSVSVNGEKLMIESEDERFWFQKLFNSVDSKRFSF